MMDAPQHQLPPRRLEGRRSPIHIFCFTWMLFWCMGVPSLLLGVGIYLVVDQTFDQAPHYSVAIDSVSGLDPVFGGRHALDPEFNLTFRVESHGFWVRKCAEPGINIEVSYGSVPLASNMTTTEKICAGPRKSVDQSLVARGVGVVVPDSVLDRLAGDMRNGVQVFDVELRAVGKNVSWNCGPRRVNDHCALETECLKSGGSSGHA